MLHLHYDLLDRERREIFERLKPFKKEAILAGGTALFLQIAHRFSFDFDIFLQRELKRADLLKLRRLLEIKEIRLNTSEQLNAVTSKNILITLVYYPYKPLFRAVPTISLPLFSVKDIALDKAFTIGRRGLWRDYVDLFFLFKNKYIEFPEIIKLAEKKFDLEFNPRLFFEQLIYFQGLKIETTKVSFIKEKYSPQEIKNFLKNQVEDFKKKNII